MSLSQKQEEGLRRLLASKAKYVIGIDEVGYGAWAGPLVVAGAVFLKGWGHPEVKDSKTYKGSKNMSAHEKRLRVLTSIIEPALIDSSIMSYANTKIDQLGVGEAQARLVEAIIEACIARSADAVVVLDGITKIQMKGVEFVCIPKADGLVPAVSAASIIAKVFRDRRMVELAKKYPGYDFETNVGYGTRKHQQGLSLHGVSDIHRRSYRPIQNLLAWGVADVTD